MTVSQAGTDMHTHSATPSSIPAKYCSTMTSNQPPHPVQPTLGGATTVGRQTFGRQTFDQHDIWPTRHLADTTKAPHYKSTPRHIAPSLLNTVCRPRVVSAKFLSANCLSAKYRVCQMSYRPNVVSLKFQFGQMSVGQISVGQISC